MSSGWSLVGFAGEMKRFVKMGLVVWCEGEESEVSALQIRMEEKDVDEEESLTAQIEDLGEKLNNLQQQVDTKSAEFNAKQKELQQEVDTKSQAVDATTHKLEESIATVDKKIGTAKRKQPDVFFF